MLEALPGDCLQSILSRVEVACILTSIAPVCSALHEAALSDGLWQALAEARYAVLLRCLFDGQCPQPPPHRPWREHYFDLASNFLQHASQRGRVVFVIENIVYDATSYVDKHPGMPEVLIAAAGHDATAAFHAVGHSPSARNILGTLAVASRDALVAREDAALCARWRRHVQQQQQGGGAAAEAQALPTWRTYGHAVLAGMRSEAGRASLRSMFRLGLSALVTDLTEGRPDCRRLSPAVWRLVESELLAHAGRLK